MSFHRTQILGNLGDDPELAFIDCSFVLLDVFSHNRWSDYLVAGQLPPPPELAAFLALAAQQTLVFVDESGFYLLPAVGRTYAPMGQTPILCETLTRDHRSLIGGLTMEGHLFIQGQERALRSTDVVRFLKHLLRYIAGKLLIVWDGTSIHYGTVKDFLRAGAARRITLQRLPSYAPELNPMEGVWHYLKHVELLNVCCHTLADLCHEIRSAIARVRHRADVLAGCIRQPGCY